jgi:hypothetical protein
MPREKRERSTRYYRWEEDACRIHVDADGNETADTYRAGNVYLPLSAADVVQNGVEISRAAYQDLVDEEEALQKYLNPAAAPHKLILLNGGRSHR